MGCGVWGVVLPQFGWKKYEHPTWNGFSRGALSRARWHTFGVTQALPQMISAALEEWQLQVIAFLAAKLGEVQIATHNSLVNLFYVMTSCMYGLVSSTKYVLFHCNVRPDHCVCKRNACGGTPASASRSTWVLAGSQMPSPWCASPQWHAPLSVRVHCLRRLPVVLIHERGNHHRFYWCLRGYCGTVLRFCSGIRRPSVF